MTKTASKDKKKEKIYRDFIPEYQQFRSIGVIALSNKVSKQYVAGELKKDDRYESIKSEPLQESAIVNTFIYFAAIDPHTALANTAKQYRRHHGIGQNDALRILQKYKKLPFDREQLENNYSILLCDACENSVIVPWGAQPRGKGGQYRCTNTDCNKYFTR